MFYLTSFLFLIFSPGLRGLALFYYPALFLSVSSVFYLILKDPTLKVSFKRPAAFPYLIILTIYSFVLLSILSLDYAVSLSELIISIFRFLLAFVFFLSAIIFPRKLFFSSLTLAIFISCSLSALILYLQAILNVPFDFLSAEAATRADLTRYSSSMGSLTAASIGLPLSTFSYAILQYFCTWGANFSSLERRFYSVPSIVTVPLWLISTIFTVSRTAIFTSLLVIFAIYVLPFILRIRLSSISIFSLKIRKLFLLLFAGVCFSASFLFAKFSSFLEVTLAFFAPDTSQKLSYSGVNNVFDDFNERLSMFDEGAFEFPRFLIGEGYHHVSGPLGITSAGKFSHNTFVDLFHIFGILGPFLLLLLVFYYIYAAYKSWCKSPSLLRSKIASANLGFALLMIPTMLTTSGVLYVPLLMIPFFALYCVNSISYID